MRHYTSRTRCQRTAFGEVDCTLDFAADPEASRNVIADWKDGIPYKHRSYTPETKVWRFQPLYADLAVEILLEHLPGADVPRRPRQQTRAKNAGTPKPGNDHFRILHLRETAPVELIEASYRVLARMNHPDLGGSDEAMRALNGAYAALRERVRA